MKNQGLQINELTVDNMRISEDLVKGSIRVFYHVAVMALSAAFALSLPFTANFFAKNFLVYWSFIGNERTFLISVEMVLAISLVLFFNYISRSWKDRKLSNMARDAGLLSVIPTRGFLARRRMRKLKEKEGFARDVMVIGSTGYRTFVDPKGDLHPVIKNCREARIMLLHPYSEGASARAKSILDPGITPEIFAEQIRRSIDFLKELKAVQKKVRLKLYQDIPLLKLAILGDYIWIRHYHAGLDVQSMPEYVFKHDQNSGSLYIPFYQYFLTRWNHPDIPEYDLDTDELMYRDLAGNVIRRERLDQKKREVDPHTDLSNHLALNNHNHLGGYPHPFMQKRRDRVSIEDLFKNIW